jgi:hypothetical protein
VFECFAALQSHFALDYAACHHHSSSSASNCHERLLSRRSAGAAAQNGAVRVEVSFFSIIIVFIFFLIEQLQIENNVRKASAGKAVALGCSS